MEISLRKLWVISILIIQQFAFLADASHSRKKIVPALYVFGDSTVDAGNNNNLKTLAKANKFPYGIDFNNCSTGRFSNGKTIADIIGNFSTFLLEHCLCLYLFEVLCFHVNMKNNITRNFMHVLSFVAIRLGLPMPPPYLGVPKSQRHQVVTGLNYASGSCGILNSTRSVRFKIKNKRIQYIFWSSKYF